MKQVVHYIRQADFNQRYVKVLKLELDYELATLYEAMQAMDEIQKEKSKSRLQEICHELELLSEYA